MMMMMMKARPSVSEWECIRAQSSVHCCFIIILEALSREFREGLPMELLYTDDLVLVAETEELLMDKLHKWKRGMKLEGLRVNIGMTKVMRFQVRIGQAEESGKYPCGVCRQGVGDNSIKCVACHKWIHKRCSGISGRLGVCCRSLLQEMFGW